MDLPLHGRGPIIEPGWTVPGGSSGGILLTSGSSHVKGSYTTVVAAIPPGVLGFWVAFTENSSYRYYLDLAYGTAGNERIIVPDLRVYQRPNSVTPWVYVPIALPAGARLAARIQGGGAGNTAAVSIYFNRAGFHTPAPLQWARAYGLTAASTLGTDVDPGAVANTKGSWAELVASTSDPIRSLIVCVGAGSTVATPPAADRTMRMLLDIGIGAAASEQVVLSNLQCAMDGVSDVVGVPWLGPFDVYIPAGTRIAARAQATKTTTPERVFDVSLVGCY